MRLQKPKWILSPSIAFTVALTLLASATAVHATSETESCYMLTSSGKKIILDKVCGFRGNGAMSTFMWDENNYDPQFVEKTPEGYWSVAWGAPHPFRAPDGSIIWPDGRLTSPDGITMRPILGADGTRLGTQYYAKDGKTPLKPGETISVPNGLTFEQQKF